MEITKRKGSRSLAGHGRNPSRDTIKMLKPIIPHRRRRRHYIRIRFTQDFWGLLGIICGLTCAPIIYTLLQQLGEAIW